MPTYLLDIVIEEAQLYTPCSTIRTPIWITIRADGLQQPFNSPQVPACPRPSWRTPVRLVLNLPNLQSGHFKATLRTAGYLGEVSSVACSQVHLNTLPIGRPGRFNFPLQHTQDFSVQAATLWVTACISELELRPQPPPSQPQMGMQPVWIAPPAPATAHARTRNTEQPPRPPRVDGWNPYPGAVPRRASGRA
jgi:hypothetical protein